MWTLQYLSAIISKRGKRTYMWFFIYLFIVNAALQTNHSAVWLIPVKLFHSYLQSQPHSPPGGKHGGYISCTMAKHPLRSVLASRNSPAKLFWLLLSRNMSAEGKRSQTMCDLLVYNVIKEPQHRKVCKGRSSWRSCFAAVIFFKKWLYWLLKVYMAVLEMIFSQRDQRGRLIVTATCWVPQIFPSTCCWNPSQRDGDFCQGPLNESVASALRLQLQCLGLFNDVLMAWLYYLSAAQTTLNTPWPINPASTKKTSN